jgi:regulator of sirC expression with transglutaminase-like and TPR domain
LADINKAIRLNSKDAPVLFQRGMIFREMGENQKAITDIVNSINLGLPKEMEQAARQMLIDIQKSK